jgi:LmbE family N-acetylglucosaminyl deacetylase
MEKLRALFLGAHPDDCEAGGGGLALMLARAGHEVKFLSLTDGSSGAYKDWGEKAKKLRYEDAARVSKFLGCEYEIFDIQDGKLQPDIPTREKLIRAIRRFNPDLLFSHRMGDYHPDHHYTNALTVDAAYLLKVPAICPDVPPMRSMPVILYYQDRFTRPYPLDPAIVIDISGVWDDKFKMLLLHEDQFFDWLPWADENIDEPAKLGREKLISLARKMMEPLCVKSAQNYQAMLESEYGKRNFTHAEAFELAEHGSQLSQEIKAALLKL